MKLSCSSILWLHPGVWEKGGTSVFALLICIQGGLSLVKKPRREAEAKSICDCLSPLFLHVCAHTDAWSDYRGAPKSCVTCVQSTVTVKGTVPVTYWCALSINCNSKMLCYCLI